MAYSNTIDYLKSALSDYSAEEEKLSNLYKQAAKNAQANYDFALNQLENQYYNDQNAAYADNARIDRNTGVILAEKGLGFSGESAQSKLNSNIALMGRLGALASEKNKNAQQLNLDLANQKSNLSMDEAEKLRKLIESKNGLISDIAGMELDYEIENAKLDADAEKLKAEIDMHNSSLEADRDRQNAELEAEWNRLMASINADKEMHNSSIEADRDRQNAELEAEWNRLMASINADKEMHNSSIEAERNKQNANLEAEREMHNAELESEREMFYAELNAKYNEAKNSDKNSSSNKNNGNSGNSGNSNSVGTNFDSEEDIGYTPDISAKELAKQLIGSATENGRIDSVHDRYNVNRYLLELNENYSINEDYMKELILMLKSFGYEEKTVSEMRREVISYDAYEYYGKVYDSVYEKEIQNGRDEASAKSIAASSARKSKIGFVYSQSKHLNEFLLCCKEIGFSTYEVNAYLESIKNNDTPSNSGQYYGGTTHSSK